MEITNIGVTKIIQKENSRARVSNSDLSELMTSIKQDGVLQPIGVRKTSKSKYEILFGNRRLLAVKKLGLQSIPAIVFENKGDEQFLVMNLIENTQRKDISIWEEGRTYHLLKEMGLTDSEVGARVAKPVKRIKKALSVFFETPAHFRHKIVNGSGRGRNKKDQISASTAMHALTIRKGLNLSNKQMNELLEGAAAEGLKEQNMRQVGRLVKSGMTVKRALKVAQKVKTVVITIVMDQGDINRIENRYGQSVNRVFLSNLEHCFDFNSHNYNSVEPKKTAAA